MSASQYEIEALVVRARELRDAPTATAIDYIQSEALLKQALELQDKLTGLQSLRAAEILNEVGLTQERAGASERAVEAFSFAVHIYEGQGDTASAVSVINNAARLAESRGFQDQANLLRTEAINTAVSHARLLSSELATVREQLQKAEAELQQLRPPAPKPSTEPQFELLTPQQIKKRLDKSIIGQESAKRTLSVVAWKHMAAQFLPPAERARIQKANVLVIGPTGVGKTELMKALAKIVGVPFYKADASNLTESGFIGDKAETFIHDLLKQCDFDVQQAQRAIIFLDEIDKKASAGNIFGTDLSGKGAQKGLLKLIEGTKVRCPGKGLFDTAIDVDTSNILFIAGGAFAGLVDHIATRRRETKTSIGFGADVSTDTALIMREAETEDLVKFGMMRELMGRLPVITHLDELTTKQLKSIMTEPEDSLEEQMRILLSPLGLEFAIEDEARELIASAAEEKKTGARGLRSILEAVLVPVLYELPTDGKVTITPAMVRDLKRGLAQPATAQAEVVQLRR